MSCNLEIIDNSDTVKKFVVKNKNSLALSTLIIASLLTFAGYKFYLLQQQTQIQQSKNLEALVDNSIVQIFATAIKTTLGTLICVITSAFIAYMKTGTLAKESLIVIKDTGIQIEKKYTGGKKSVQFVDISRLKDIIIHEGMTSFDVRYFLAIILKDGDHLIIPFEDFKLKFDQMKEILASSRDLIRGA